MTLTKITYYFQQKHQLIDNQKYYFKLSLIIGIVLTVFVYIFDPYDNHLAVPKFEIPIKIIQIGYGIITALVIYSLYWLLFRKLKFAKGKRAWRTYHHWLLLVAILSIAGFIGTVYHRFMMDVGEVDTQYYLFVTIPRSVSIAIPLFIITLLLDQLYTSQQRLKVAANLPVTQVATSIDSNKKIILKSPVVNQCIEVVPSQIEYIKASGNYVEIYTTEAKKVQLLRASLRFIAECLQSYPSLVQCHRQYYVNIQKIKSHKGNSQRILLNLETATNEIPVSKSYVKKILLYIQKEDN
ncbi:putative two-component response-regulatory protein YehT [Kordia sp. SMS9]|uniref:LytTR family DNA-binding domain-containing protein n=1 Tax=Kordia sp. SMS9 TaxID=2282170 RepID=UPI000E0D9568|nr:LytTR family DNA-binding domain-containing protein [Kordia sp. SMS9]AXG71494.1 putative two-component response-regulatory protein YehT [Kordia sp. SMS9]